VTGTVAIGVAMAIFGIGGLIILGHNWWHER
jgi:hypothetical protein